MPDNSMYVEPVIAVNADMSGVQNPSMYKPVTVVNMPSSPTSGVTSVNGQTGEVTLTASDVGALPSSTVIPSVDQTYNASSTNAQSGVAVASAIAASAPTLADLNTAGITDIQQVAALPASPVSTVLYLIPET